MSFSQSDPPPESQPRPVGPALEVPGYEIGPVLGRGSSGIVYRARQLAVDREVALKVLHPELSAKGNVVRRLQREARTTARLAHPNVVSAIDMGETDGRWWYAMELVEGPSLERRLRSEGRLNEREVLRLFIPLCEALEHLWEHGVVHRDVKPANILIDRTGTARLADLGLAFADDDPGLTKTGGMLGTPHYVSPEQTVDPRSVDIRSDIWSLGATLFHSLCGEPPFAGGSSAEVLSAVLYESIPDPIELEPELSKGMALVIRKCLVRDVRKRYQTPRELRRDLERIRERRAPTVRRSRLDPVRRSESSWSGLRETFEVRSALVMVAVLVFGSVAAVWSWFQYRAAANTTPPVQVGEERAAWDPVDDLGRRFEEGESPVALLAELRTVAPRLDELHPQSVSAIAGLEATLLGRLRQSVEELEGSLDQTIQGLLGDRDFVAAKELVEGDLDLQAIERTGANTARLRGLGVSLDSWRNRTLLSIEERTQRALDSLAGGLADWRKARMKSSDKFLADGHWDEARALLLPSDEDLLAAVDLAGARFADRRGDDVLAHEQVLFRLRRQRVDEDWRLVDGVLRRFVIERSAELQEELERAGRLEDAPSEAGETLREEFRRRLGAKKLTFASFPESLQRSSLEAFEQALVRLDSVHAARVEESARAEMNELEVMAAGFARRRDYSAMSELWSEAEFVFKDPENDDGWREELAQRVDRRREEAMLLEDLFVRAAQRVRAMVGRPVDLRLGGILYQGVRVEVEEPLRSRGFRLVNGPGKLFLQTLPGSTYEELIGLASPASLSSIDRFRLASFRFADGDFGGARSALADGPLPASEPWRALVLDLQERIESSLAERSVLELERKAEAERLLEIALDRERSRWGPRGVLARIDRLLEEFGDLPVVLAKKEQLLELRDELRGADAPASAAGFEASFAPTFLAFPDGERVQMAFDFTGDEVGTWEQGEWVSDAKAWLPTARLRTWEQFKRQRGPRLVLREPLNIDGDSLEIEMEFEAAQEELRLIVITAAGFHVAFVGEGLPGDEAGARWLVGTESLLDFLARLEEGAGEARQAIPRPGSKHVVRLVLNRRSGRIDLELDGESIGSAHPSAPDPDARTLDLRTWDQVRLLRVVIQAEL